MPAHPSDALALLDVALYVRRLAQRGDLSPDVAAALVPAVLAAGWPCDCKGEGNRTSTEARAP